MKIDVEQRLKASNSKMYICVHDDVPDHMVPVLVAHTVLNADRRLTSLHPLIYRGWNEYSFKKVVVRLNDKEFEKIKELSDSVSLSLKFQKQPDYDVTTFHFGTEATLQTTLGACCGITVLHGPRVPNVLKFAKLWSPKQ